MERIFYYSFLSEKAKEYYSRVAERYMFEDFEILCKYGEENDLYEAIKALLMDDPYFYTDLKQSLQGPIFRYRKDGETERKMAEIRKTIWIDAVSNFKIPFDKYIRVFELLIQNAFDKYKITDEYNFLTSKLLSYTAELQNIPCIIIEGENNGKEVYWNTVEASGFRRHCVKEDRIKLYRDDELPFTYDEEKFQQIWWWEERQKQISNSKKGTKYLMERVEDYLSNRHIIFNEESEKWTNRIRFNMEDLSFTLHFNNILNSIVIDFFVRIPKHEYYREKMKDLISFGVKDDCFYYSICTDPERQEYGVFEVLDHILEDGTDDRDKRVAAFKNMFDEVEKAKGDKKKDGGIH